MSLPIISNTAAAAPAVPFLNLQYIYCSISALFGKACANVGTPDVPSVPDVSGSIPTTTLPVADTGGFWSWLWPFGSSGGSTSDVVIATTTAASEPGFLLTTVGVIGSVLFGLWTLFSWISYTVSFGIFIVIVVAFAGLVLIRMDEWQRYGTLPPPLRSVTKGKQRWQDLLNEAMSSEPKRWREAIIAADNMLGILLTRLGYHGKTTGEQMRAVPEGAFVTVPVAWEAHRVKNFVAARSSDFVLTQREAFRVMKLYEQVFEEFDFI